MATEPYESDRAEPHIEEVPAPAPAESVQEKTKRRRHRGGRGRGKKAGATQPAVSTEETVSEPYESDIAEPQLVAKATPVLTEAEPPAEQTESPQADEAAKKSAPRRRHRSHRKKTAPPAEAGAPSESTAPPEAGMIREDALAYMPSEATAVPQPTAEIHSDAPASVEQSDPSAPAKQPRRRYYRPRKKKETGSQTGESGV
jgi:ribonuclease E